LLAAAELVDSSPVLMPPPEVHAKDEEDCDEDAEVDDAAAAAGVCEHVTAGCGG